jgi:hypothetical protein
MNNYMSINNRNTGNPNNMGNYGGQGLKRMRADDFRTDNASSAHRVKWDTADDDKNMTFMERNDVDQRSEYDNKTSSLVLFIFFLLFFFVFLHISNDTFQSLRSIYKYYDEWNNCTLLDCS